MRIAGYVVALASFSLKGGHFESFAEKLLGCKRLLDISARLALTPPQSMLTHA